MAAKKKAVTSKATEKKKTVAKKKTVKKAAPKKAAPKKAPILPDETPARRKSAAKAKGKIDLSGVVEEGGDQDSLEAALLGRFT